MVECRCPSCHLRGVQVDLNARRTAAPSRGVPLYGSSVLRTTRGHEPSDLSVDGPHLPATGLDVEPEPVRLLEVQLSQAPRATTAAGHSVTAWAMHWAQRAPRT